jgi:hypothetical protein
MFLMTITVSTSWRPKMSGGFSGARGEHAAEPRRRKRRLLGAAVAAVGAEAAWLRARTGRYAGHVVVRCRQGHLFTTLWIPGASVKAVRLGPWRAQRCPVGPHWSLVRPVDDSQLDPAELAAARERVDSRLP